MVSTDGIESCVDKLAFYDFCKYNDIVSIATSQNIDDIHAQTFVVKERFGAGSKNIGINLGKKQALIHAKKLENPIFQPFIDGDEYSIDIYQSNNTNIKGVVVRARELVIDGESKITTLVNDLAIAKTAQNLVSKLHLQYHSISQVFKTQDDKIYLIECNPRFGGASTLSLAAGLDSFYWFFLESTGHKIDNIKSTIKRNNLKLIRYSEDLIL